MDQFRQGGNLVHSVEFVEHFAAKPFKIILIPQLFLTNYFLRILGRKNNLVCEFKLLKSCFLGG